MTSNIKKAINEAIEYKESTKILDALDTALLRFKILLKNIE